MRSIGKDVQFALRAFLKSLVFTAVALLSDLILHGHNGTIEALGVIFDAAAVQGRD